ncbi:MAG: ORF6N domain-containing protein [Planctomycetes bacterium]|nr:ORF6N domain-containing protein [Planctomycetota bacterium]
MAKSSESIIPVERIKDVIFVIRGHKVMVDSELARLYGVETRILIQSAKRNIERFPTDFMFQLSEAEAESLRSQIVISKVGRGGRRYAPYVFTEQGIAMLSSVLRSKRAVEVNIAIMRTFVKLREILATNASLRRKIESMECKYNEQFQAVFSVLAEMTMETEKPKRKIGYHTQVKKATSKKKASRKKTKKAKK